MKKTIAVLLVLATVLFSFSVNGFASETEEEFRFGDIKIFSGCIALDYSGYFVNDDCYFELKETESETVVIASDGFDGDFRDSGEKIIFAVKNEDFIADAVYSFTVKQNNTMIMNRIFIASEIMATVPEFTNSTYRVKELEEKDMTEEVLVPVNYEENIVFTTRNEFSSLGKNRDIFGIDGMTVKAKECGWCDLVLKDSHGNAVDEARLYADKNTPHSFADAFKLSFKKFMAGAEESLQFLPVLPSMIIGPILTPFMVVAFIVSFPFQIM